MKISKCKCGCNGILKNNINLGKYGWKVICDSKLIGTNIPKCDYENTIKHSTKDKAIKMWNNQYLKAEIIKQIAKEKNIEYINFNISKTTIKDLIGFVK